MQHGSQLLFVDANFQIDPGNKVGLVGPNGAGKSTIFRLIEGEESVDEGRDRAPSQAHRRLLFRQEVGDWSGRTTLEPRRWRAQATWPSCATSSPAWRARLEDVDSADDYDDVLDRYGHVQDQFATLGGYDLEARAARILAGLGLAPDQIEGPIDALSGGWKMRVALAQVLAAPPEVLLLDEPTNHLDIESILWLEQFLRDYPGTVVMTCHDHDVMNRVVSPHPGDRRRPGPHLLRGLRLLRSASGASGVRGAARRRVRARQQAMLAKEIALHRAVPRPSRASPSAVQQPGQDDRQDRAGSSHPRRYVERDFALAPCPRSGDEVLKVHGREQALRRPGRARWPGPARPSRRALVRCWGANGAGQDHPAEACSPGRSRPDAGRSCSVRRADGLLRPAHH